MATPYTGNPLAAQAPGPAPAPDTLPVVSQPADADGGTWGNIYQAIKEAADYLGALQRAARFLTRLAVASPAAGFSSVIQTGAGAGVITPNGGAQPWASDTMSGLRFVIKIIASGAVGVATYQWSSDGGNTFSGTLTTAASITQAGVTMTMVNTFTAGDTYSFSQIDGPRIQATDAAGVAHTVLADANGYMIGGGGFDFHERWLYSFALNSVNFTLGNRIAINVPWSISGSGSGFAVTCPDVAYDTGAGFVRAIELLPGGTNGNYVHMFDNVACWKSGTPTNLCVVKDWAVWTDPNGITDFDLYTGFVKIATSFATGGGAGTDNFGFKRVANSANWSCFSRAAGVETTVDTGVVATSNRVYRMRTVYYGPTSPPNSERIAFFIGAPFVPTPMRHVATISTNIPTGLQMQMAATVVAKATTTARGIRILPIDMCTNPFPAEFI